jgi:hypothetical protein
MIRKPVLPQNLALQCLLWTHKGLTMKRNMATVTCPEDTPSEDAQVGQSVANSSTCVRQNVCPDSTAAPPHFTHKKKTIQQTSYARFFMKIHNAGCCFRRGGLQCR